MKKSLRITGVMIFVFAGSLFANNESDSELLTRIQSLEERITVLESYILPIVGADAGENQTLPLKDIEKEIIGLELVDLSYHESNAANDYANDYRDWISISFMILNNSGKDIKAIKGAVVFSDLFGEEWMRIGLTVSDPIKAAESFLWEGSIDYNGFIDQHKKLRNTGINDVLVKYDVTQILFADGERISYE